MPLPIFTIQTFNQNSLQPAGAVFAHRVDAVGMPRGYFSGSSNGRTTAVEKKMNDLTKVLMEELQMQTIKAYPNAVALVDVKMEMSNIGKDDSNIFLAGQASATALIKRNKPITMVQPQVQPQAQPQVQPQSDLASEPVATTEPVVPLVSTRANGPMAMNSPIAAPMPAPGPMAGPGPMAAPAPGPMPNAPKANASVGGKYISKISKSRKHRK